MFERPDLAYMKRAIRLARLARGKTSPNPMVGAVIVRNGKIVGEGYHHAAGEPHAEALALKAAGEQAKGATLYSNLEPCCHTAKRTPPCTEIIIRNGIRHVVSAMKDPNPMVYGKGFEALRVAGIEVVEGLLYDEALRLNEAFIRLTTSGRPFVILKAAMTLDGRIATASGESKWISGKRARREVDRLRADVDAVMVGIGTVLADDPMLVLRQIKGKNPSRVVIDPGLKIPFVSKLLRSISDAPVLLVTSSKASSQKIARLREQGIQVGCLSEHEGMIPFDLILDYLGKLGMASVLIEGGGVLNGIALRSGLVDRVIFHIAPKFLCGEDALGVVRGRAIAELSSAIVLENVKIRRMGEDIRVEGSLRRGAELPGRIAGDASC